MSDRPVLRAGAGGGGLHRVVDRRVRRGERWLLRFGIIQADIDPAVAVLLHLATGMLHMPAAASIGGPDGVNAAAVETVAISAVPTFSDGWSPSGWPPRKHVSGCPTKARHASSRFSAEPERIDAVDLGRAAISLSEGDPANCAVLGEFQDFMPPHGPGLRTRRSTRAHHGPPTSPRRSNRRRRRGRSRAAGRRPIRLIFRLPCKREELLDALHITKRRTARCSRMSLTYYEEHTAKLIDRQRLPHPEELSPSELRVLRVSPTNLTGLTSPLSLHVSVNTVENTCPQRIYSGSNRKPRNIDRRAPAASLPPQERPSPLE